MKGEIFAKILLRRLVLIKKGLTSKGKEYAGNSDDRLINFKRSGEMKRETPEKALQGMMQKHLTSIYDIIDYIEKENQMIGLMFTARPKGVSKEIVEEKLGDLINYCILLEALLKERYEYE